MARRRIILLGATGYTGRHVLRELLARDVTPTLAGRDRDRIAAVAADRGAEPPVVEVDVASPAALGRLFGPDDVVVSTVGPFIRLGGAVVEAAARAGAHYLDSTGEAPFVRRVFGLGPAAERHNACLVPAFGYDYVPGNLAGALALRQAGESARHVAVGYFFARSGVDPLRYRGTLRDAFTLTSPGTRATLVGSMAHDGLSYRAASPGQPGRLDVEPVGERLLRFDYAGVRRAALSVGASEHLGLPESFPHLESVDVGLGWFGRWTRPAHLGIKAQRPLWRMGWARAGVERLSRRLPGSRREPDGDGASLVIAVARDAADRRLATVALTGPDPYALTASLLAWGATRMADPSAAPLPGAHGPVAAFGLEELRAGAAGIGLRETAPD